MTDTSRRPALATPITRSRERHGELIDTCTGRAWISLEPMTQEDYEGLSLPPGFVHVALGRTAMEEHWFTRSPDQGEDGAWTDRSLRSPQSARASVFPPLFEVAVSSCDN